MASPLGTFACFACGSDVATENARATAFLGHPSYGSRFDSATAGNEPLEIHVCDDCLEAHAERINLRKETSNRTYERRGWLCPDCLRPMDHGQCPHCAKEATS